MPYFGLSLVIFGTTSLAGQIAHYGSCWGCESLNTSGGLTSFILGGVIGIGMSLCILSDIKNLKRVSP